MGWLFLSKTKTYECPGRGPVVVYRNAKHAFPIQTNEVKLSFDAAGNGLDQASIKLGGRFENPFISEINGHQADGPA